MNVDEINRYKNFTLSYLNQKGIGSKRFSIELVKSGSIKEMYKNFNNDNNIDILANLLKYNIRVKCIWEEDYPDFLRNIYNPPAVIYYCGSWSNSLFRKTISIVGTRKMTPYGESLARSFAQELSNEGFTIVSGLAIGIDSAAQDEALKSNGKVIIVLPASPNNPYPRTNANLYKEIINNGGIALAELGPGVQINPGLFANRNRIIAGLSMATLVIEAGEKSGALITADLAFENDRHVFAIPGDIKKSYSKGTNNLIKEGKAKLVTSSEDILLELGFQKRSEEKAKINSENLTDLQEKIYRKLLASPVTIDTLAFELSEISSRISAEVNLLEIKGILKKDTQNKYYLV